MKFFVYYLFATLLNTHDYQVQFNQTIASNELPQSFVSLSYKNHDDAFEELFGGFLIYPGVVATNMHYPSVHYKKLKNIDLYKEQLYVIFRGSKKEHVIAVDKIVNYKSYNLGIDDSPLSLVFFTPNKEIQDIAPVPLVSYKDFSFRSDLLGDIWAVGLSDQGENSHSCLEESKKKMVKVSYRYTQKEYVLASELMRLVPGDTKSIRDSYAEHHNTDFENLPYMFFGDQEFYVPMEEGISLKDRVVYDYVNLCKFYPFCFEPKEPRRGSCVHHLGYPYLYQDAKGDFKAFAVSSVMHPNLLGTDNLLDVSHYFGYSLLYSMGKIADSVSEHKSIDRKTTPFFDNAVREKAKSETPHEDFLVRFFRKTENQDYIKKYGKYFRFCSGALIAEGVVISSAHCFIDEEGSKRSTEKIFVALEKNNKEYSFDIQKVIVHPDYFVMPDYYSSSDIALAFFEPSEELRIDALDMFVTFKNRLDFESIKKQNIFAITNHGYMKYGSEEKFPRSHRWLRLTPKTIHEIYAKRLVKKDLILGDKALFFNWLSELTGLGRDDDYAQAYSEYELKVNTSLSKKMEQIGDNEGDGLFFFVADERYHYIEREDLSCGGDSGSPVVVRNGESRELVGVFSGHDGIRGIQYRPCGWFNRSVNVTVHKEWIESTIKANAF